MNKVVFVLFTTCVLWFLTDITYCEADDVINSEDTIKDRLEKEKEDVNADQESKSSSLITEKSTTKAAEISKNSSETGGVATTPTYWYRRGWHGGGGHHIVKAAHRCPENQRLAGGRCRPIAD